MLMRVLALSGHKGSGKDTMATVLANEYGYTPVSFAASLKDMVSKQYNVPREYMDDPTRKEMPLHQYPAIPTDAFTIHIQQLLLDELRSGFWTPRALCILEGSTKRSVNSSFWVKDVISKIIYAPDQKFVITDLRYKSEADVLNLMIPEIELIRIHRDDLRITTEDPSERDMDDYRQFSTVLSNYGNLQQFHDTINFYMNGRLGREYIQEKLARVISMHGGK